MTFKLPPAVEDRFEVFDWRNALAILHAVHPGPCTDILAVLSEFHLRRSDIERAGGAKSPIARSLDDPLVARGWRERKFDTRVVVDGVSRATPTHKVDCFKDRVALEVEWNNKDPFFDRDLNNFRLLYDLGVIDVGVIVTRSSKLFDILNRSTRERSTYGQSTTHTEKLLPRLLGGGAGGCPVAVFGIGPGAYRDDL